MARKIPFLELLVRSFPELGRERLLGFVVCGEAYLRGERLRDPRRMVDPEAGAELRLPPSGTGAVPGLPFVSRGGYKLDGALKTWKPPVEGRVWLDAGSSTGGFTHALLLAGASMVHAVDVGYNLLDWRLRNSGLVQIHERTNFMDLGELDPPVWAAVADLSFRSLQGAASRLISKTQSGILIALIKPQFEFTSDASGLGPGDATHGFKGVLTDQAVIHQVLCDLASRLGLEGVCIRQLMPSPLKGGQGNQEYLAWFESPGLDCQELVATSLGCIEKSFSS